REETAPEGSEQVERQTVSGWWTRAVSRAWVNQAWNWVKGEEGWSWVREREFLVYWSACGEVLVPAGATGGGLNEKSVGRGFCGAEGWEGEGKYR
ncbi:MAG: hypothetical protein Q9194_005427, partial [Teloschistes cf. exilis]